MADAPYQALPLLGGEHDWAYLLGLAGLDALDSAPFLAAALRVAALLLVGSEVAACGWALLRRRTHPTPALAGPSA